MNERLTFLAKWRQHEAGDVVPPDLDHGTVDALQRRGIISRPEKQCRPERDKMFRRTKTKAVEV